jgi:hypothetical protein
MFERRDKNGEMCRKHGNKHGNTLIRTLHKH